MIDNVFEYSFVIRTIGTAGKKYQALLDSISKQTFKPKEVLVVLPEGYNPPQERLGWERFVFTPKGMVAQRALCLNEIKTEYALFCDDDWEFETRFIEIISKPIFDGKADVSFPIFPELLPQGFKTRLVMAILGSAVPMVFPGQYYTKILKSGNYSYNPYLKNSKSGEFLAETAPGLCFFIKTDDMKKCHFEHEMWLQDANYAIPEDQVMFYKLHLLGKRIIGVGGVVFKHLDAGSSNHNRSINTAYALSRNKYIFWHRFIYLQQNSIFSRYRSIIAFKWIRLKGFTLKCLLSLLNAENENMSEARKRGYEDAKSFINSKEYKRLPNIK